MVIGKLAVRGTRLLRLWSEEIPSGIQGGQIAIVYEDPVWQGLQKTVVFRGAETKDVVSAGELVTVPAETVRNPGMPLWVGIYGTDGQGNLVIPTVWTELGKVRAGAEACGDSSTEQTLPVWAQLLEMIGDTAQLKTAEGGDLVSAVNSLIGQTGQPDAQLLAQCVEAYLTQNPPEAGKDGLDGADGADGADGQDGYTPVRGTDYWTEEDREQIVQEVIAALGTPVFGTVDNENVITLSGTLAEGTYTLCYENEDGSLLTVGTVTVGSGVSYTNLAEADSEDWVENYRINSSGVLTEVTEAQRGSQNMVITNYISTAGVETFHYRGIDVTDALTESGQNYSRFYFYDGNRAYLGSYQCSNRLTADFSAAEYDENVTVCDFASFKAAVSVAHSASYIRFGGIVTEDTVIITADAHIA